VCEGWEEEVVTRGGYWERGSGRKRLGDGLRKRRKRNGGANSGLGGEKWVGMDKRSEGTRGWGGVVEAR